MSKGISRKATMAQGRAWYFRFSFCGAGWNLGVMVALRSRAALNTTRRIGEG